MTGFNQGQFKHKESKIVISRPKDLIRDINIAGIKMSKYEKFIILRYLR